MILISLKLQLLSNKPEPAISASPFLGGVLHGSFEGLIRLHRPEELTEFEETEKIESLFGW